MEVSFEMKHQKKLAAFFLCGFLFCAYLAFYDQEQFYKKKNSNHHFFSENFINELKSFQIENGSKKISFLREKDGSWKKKNLDILEGVDQKSILLFINQLSLLETDKSFTTDKFDKFGLLENNPNSTSTIVLELNLEKPIRLVFGDMTKIGYGIYFKEASSSEVHIASGHFKMLLMKYF